MKRGVETTRSVISQSTLTPLRNMIFAISVSAGATWWAATIAARLERIETALTAAAHDKVAAQDMKLWIMQLSRENAAMHIPDWPN